MKKIILLIFLFAATLVHANTYYLASYGKISAPFPFDPYGGTEPIVAIDASKGIYLVEDSPQSYAALQQSHQSTRRMGAMDAPAPPGGGGGSGETLEFQTWTPPTNGLWLEWSNVMDGTAYVNLHNATDYVYEIFSKTNLLDPDWSIAGEVFPMDTNCNLFTLPLDNQPSSLFIWSRDWTGITSNGNTTPDWWLYYYYGVAGLSLSDSTLDSQGNTLLDDYENGVAPTTFTFTEIQTTNNYFNTSIVPAQLSVTGNPYYIAVSVDDTNYANDTTWQNYSSSNITVDLGLSEGWHDVWIGLRGHGDTSANGVWLMKRLKLDVTSPLLVVTNPVVETVAVPLVQIQGYSPEQLDNISYDLSNAAVVLTNQNAGITDQFYDTNTWELTTNYFECVDVSLTNGLNLITLHATDEAGNETTTNICITLDGSSRTNPPVVQLYWPQDGTLICNSNYTWRGWVDDPTAVVTAQMVDINGNTNTFNGIVERDGHFWIENLPMNGETNDLTLSVTDWLGNVATTNITVYPPSVALTIDPVSSDQLWNKTLTVTGTIGDPDDYTVWVNGVKATNNEDGTWEADNVPNTDGGTSLIQARAIPDSDNGGNGTGGGDGTSATYDNPGNPDPPQDNDAESQTDKPMRLYMATYTMDYHYDENYYYTDYNPDGTFKDNGHAVENIHFEHHWQDGQGGDEFDGDSWDNLYSDETTNVGSSALQYNWPATGNGTEIGEGMDYTNVSPPPWPSTWECGTLDYIFPWTDTGLRVGSGSFKYNYTAQTQIKLFTGGKGKSKLQNLIGLNAIATKEHYVVVGNPAQEVDLDSEGALPQEIQVAGKTLDANGNAYVILPDNDTEDVTPQVKGAKYFAFSETATKYHCHLTVYVDMPDPTGDQLIVDGDGGHAWWEFTTDAPSDAINQFISSGAAYYIGHAVGYYPSNNLSWITGGSAAGKLEDPESDTTISVSRQFDIGFPDMNGGLNYTKQLHDSPGTYNVFFHNCVHATRGAGSAAGVSLPSDEFPEPFGIDLPYVPE